MRIYKRGKSWAVDGKVNGKRVRRIVGKDKKIAEQVLHQMEMQAMREEHLGIREPQKVLFKEYTKDYLAYSKANKAEGSFERDITNIKHLVGAFGDLYLGEICPDKIEKYKIERRKAVSPASVNRELACLSHIFTLAMKTGIVRVNPLKDVAKFKEPPGRVRYLSSDEIQKLLNECHGHLRDIVLTALNTGMRSGEILGLTWDNVDLENRCIKLTKTKNNKVRVIPMNDTLYNTLMSIESRNKSGFVFLFNGKPIDSVKTAFKKALKRAEIEDFRFHDLRHTFASLLVMNGVSLQVVQKLLGHSSLQMASRYSHLSERYSREAVDVLNRRFENGTNMAHGSFSDNLNKPQT